MEVLELYTTNKQGQMELNFDALECFTTQEFAYHIKTMVNSATDREIKKVEVQSTYVYITMTSYENQVLSVYKFNRYSKEWTSENYNTYDLMQMLSYIGGVPE